MNIIIKNVRLLAAPEPPFVGTTITISVSDSPENRQFGIRSAVPIDGKEMVTLDWGDGCIETLDPSLGMFHDYANGGTYKVRFLDEIETLTLSKITTTSDYYLKFAPMVVSFVTNAAYLERLSNGCFCHAVNLELIDVAGGAVKTLGSSSFEDCAGLRGAVCFPHVVQVAGSGTALPFAGCEGLREIHFAEANKTELLASAAFQADPEHLGSPNGIVMFDL